MTLTDKVLIRFRWVACQMDHLCRLPTDAARRDALTALPPDLDGTYDRILERINEEPESSRLLVERVLNWLRSNNEFGTFMTVSELCEAVAVSPGDSFVRPDARPPLEEIMFLCSSLVRLSTFGWGIEFAHFTVDEYLSKARTPGVKPALARYRYDPSRSNYYKTRVCLTYLNMAHFRDGPSSDLTALRQRVANYPLYHFASTSWDHFLHDEELDPEKLDELKQLFSPQKEHNRRAWMQVSTT